MINNSQIDPVIFDEVKTHLTEIENQHDVIILQAIESGSRAWGFPSPDSDYDVRFIYSHPKDWYVQLNDQRDVIELPINDELDISGWDVRKAFNLANKGNAVIQEWMISPIVYRQHNCYTQLSKLISHAFNPVASYHHYRSMAKKAFFDIENSNKKKLKRFFYFARATLSAKWILEKKTIPSIVFSDLVCGLISDQEIVATINALVKQKEQESERSSLEVPSMVYREFVNIYGTLEESVKIEPVEPSIITNDDFRTFLLGLDKQI